MKYKFHPAPFLCLVAYSALESASCPELTVVLMLCSPNAYYLRIYCHAFRMYYCSFVVSLVTVLTIFTYQSNFSLNLVIIVWWTPLHHIYVCSEIVHYPIPNFNNQ